ncbi:hypothetical protein Syun_030809 [Stephania yunnanensis]|uniref:Uncharacterized protein n=1 Tax=Stephania yunnanensis TaxID=152371 RepID=A0AAP0DXY2_9MAGN
MSIALERGSGFMRGGRMSCIAAVFESPETAGDRMFPGRKVEETGDRDSCSSSSIGRNSDDSSGLSSDGEGSGEGEVQSAFKGPLETMDSLEDVLPIRKGISKFYCGKSKSFTSFADVSSASSIKDIAKPDNPYSRKRKNLLACSSAFLESRNRSFPLRGNSGGISKRPANGSRSTLALAMAMNSSDGPNNNNNNNNNSDNSNSNSTSNSSSASPSPPRLLPPLHPRAKQSLDNTAPSPPLRRSFSPWRSFSLTDLQSASSDNAAPITDTSPSSMNKRGNLNCLH